MLHIFSAKLLCDYVSASEIYLSPSFSINYIIFTFCGIIAVGKYITKMDDLIISTCYLINLFWQDLLKRKFLISRRIILNH